MIIGNIMENGGVPIRLVGKNGQRCRAGNGDVLANGILSAAIGYGQANGVIACFRINMQRILLGRSGAVTKVPGPCDRAVDGIVRKVDGVVVGLGRKSRLWAGTVDGHGFALLIRATIIGHYKTYIINA